MTLHPACILAGLGLAFAVTMAAGAQTSITPQKLPKEVFHFVGEIPAEWWTYVEITESQSFTVPMGTHFVVTQHRGYPVYVDGQVVSRLTGVLGGTGNGTRVPFAPGTILTVINNGSPTQLWGYLEPVQ